MLAAATVAVLATMILALCRAFLGRNLYDRVLAINVFGTKTVLFIAILAFVHGNYDYLDIALTYALINFVGMIAVLRLSHLREAS